MMLITTCLFLLLATSVYSSTTESQTSTASTPTETTASSTTTAPQNCEDLASIKVANGIWKNTTGSTTVNSTATLECNSGYAPSSNNTTIICQYNGTWKSSGAPKCELRDCGGLAKVDNGIWKNTNGSTTVNSTATLECNTGYAPSTNNTTIICQDDGSWNISAAPKCEVRDCGGLASIKDANGIWKNTNGSTTVNSTATLECHTGYAPSTNNTIIICQDDGNWNISAVPKCEVRDCGDLAGIEDANGTWKNTNGSTTVNSTATLECNTGYAPSTNNTTIICQDNGKWNISAAPKCKVRDCGFPSNTSVVNGTWNTNGPTTVNYTATLVCYPGYKPSDTSLTNIFCQDDGRWNDLTATCELMKLAYNDPCYINNPKQCRSQNAECKNMTIGEKWRCQCSSVFFTYNNTTDKCAPTIPEDVQLKVQNDDVHNTFIALTLNVCSTSSHTYSAHIFPSNNTTKQEFDCSAEESSEKQNSTTVFEGLSSGTQYTFILVLSVDGVTSHTNKTIVQYTKPHTPDFVNLSSITETTMDITWGFSSAQVGQYDGFSISVSPDIGSSIPIQSNTTTSYTLENLKGGTVYSVNVSSLLANLSSETPQTASECTYPTPPNNGYISSQQIDYIEISYNKTDDIIDMYSIVYNGSNFTSNDSEENTRVLNISGLQQGSYYTFNVSSLTCGKQSLESETIETFTRPGPPSSLKFSELTETTLKVEWLAPSGGVNSYLVWLIRQGQEADPKNETETTSYKFENLTEGTDYTVHVQTVWRGLTSTETSISINTAPANVTVKTTSVTEKTLNFSVTSVSEKHTYSFSLIDTRTNESNMKNGPAVQFTDLVPGRLYTLTVIATVGGVDSLYPTVVMVNTRPDRIENITLDEEKTTNTTMAISWINPEGDFDNLTVNFICTGPNRGSLNCSQRHNNGTETANCSGLDPGTFCRVEIQTKSGFQAGQIVQYNLSKSTREEAPSSVTNLTSTHLSRNITVIWRKPSMPNGFIRKYKVIVEDNTGECNNKRIVRYINCSNCRDEAESVGGECQTTTVDYAVNETAIESVRQVFSDTMHAKFTSLVPGRMYTVTVIPYTKCWGPTTVVSIWTDEEEPKGPPISINSSATQDSVTIYWEAPLCEDITGNITSYNVTVNYTDTSCYPNGTAIIKSFTTISQWFVLNGTQAYNNYTYTITAATAFGLGPPSLPTTQRTQAKAPGPVRSPTNTTITDTSVDLAWEHPCFPNGVFSSYNVTIKNRDTGELRNESSNNSSISIDKLLPYRNYTFGVVQYNEGGLAGDPEYINITTEQGVPHSIRDLHNSSRNGSSITVSWSPPDLYTGVTNYMVNCVDDHFKNLTQKEVWGFNSTELTVTDLRAYWNYTISVEAKTVAGSNNSSVINVRTKETVPGPIANLTLSPETNVTKPRTVTVVWQEPKLEDKNGVITGYVIRYGYNNSEMTNVSVSGTKTVLPNLSTGYITIKVAAKTSVGEGEVISNGTDVLPGAPLKLNESEQSLLQPSRQGVPDSERQISIMLPLRSFFCNYTNGMTTRWGLVVAETARIGGNKPYNGDVNGFKKTLESYRKWKDIKEADVIDPYIPTSSDWNPCDKADPKYRSRRSVPNVVDMPFVIGADKECDAPDHLGFCNGQLAPGRSYSVRGFVCTEGGCTESKYSPAIWTDPDLTAHIVAGVVSAVVVILVGVVFIVFMKRRQMACFAKKIERPKNVNLNGTEATEMKETVTKTHTFKPCSVRLSEFPGHVTDMHKDSNLLFADAFVMVKEKSPALSSSMAESQACRPKNRYTNILSFDHSRVKLLPLEDVEGSDFINANYIPGCKSKRAYIATQGPLPATFDDFWRMIWEQNVGVIVMLTKLVEKGRNKCDMYWPNLGEPVFFGDIVACTKSESTLSDYTLRVIELKLKDNVRMVRQFCFLKWPDMGCPDHPYLLLDFVKDVRNEYNPEVEKRGPMVVHCSAGVGRTGTFIAVDNLLQYVKEKDTVDIYNLVLEMRQNRCHMVQTEDQFIYIYECLKEFLTVKKEEEVVVVEEEPVYENTGDAVYENMGFSCS